MRVPAWLPLVFLACPSTQAAEPRNCSWPWIVASQADVTELAEAGCVELGSLTISGDVEDLRPLARLRRLQGALFLSRASRLLTLHGLEGITAIGAFDVWKSEALHDISALGGAKGSVTGIDINGAPALKSLHGLEGITGVTKTITIWHADGLQDISALSGVKGSITGWGVHIGYCEALESLHGLEGITEARTLRVRNTTRLRSLRGLEGITTVGDLRIQSNLALQNISALCGINGSNVVGFLNDGTRTEIIIEGNPSLQSLQGLEGVAAIDSLLLHSNQALKDISALSGAKGIVGGDLAGISILDCPALESLHGLEGITGVTGWGGGIRLVGNPSLRDVSALSWLRGEVGGIHIHNNTALKSLHGLEGITSVTPGFRMGPVTSWSQLASVSVSGNCLLQDLSGLRGLQGNVMELAIKDSPALLSLHGLEGIAAVSHLLLQNNRVLQDISGLGGIRGGITGGLVIRRCSALMSLHGLEGITSLGQGDSWCSPLFPQGNSLVLDSNDALGNISALSGVRGKVEYGIGIQHCPALMSLHGLEGVTALGAGCPGASLSLDFNEALRSISALHAVQGNIAGNISIHGCPHLRPQQDIEAISGVGGSLHCASTGCEWIPKSAGSQRRLRR
mmetsp:Transcript_88251/g.227571  ORF Transcript_88251/g.227571 Transcript_88251/m.227571 type:complete len:625 (+) Transcript_88251:138-2012(+)